MIALFITLQVLILSFLNIFRIYAATPTAELEPLIAGKTVQTDEVCDLHTGKALINQLFIQKL